MSLWQVSLFLVSVLSTLLFLLDCCGVMRPACCHRCTSCRETLANVVAAPPPVTPCPYCNLCSLSWRGSLSQHTHLAQEAAPASFARAEEHP